MLFAYERLLCADSVEKFFFGRRTKFLGPLMRFAHGDVRGHNVSLGDMTLTGSGRSSANKARGPTFRRSAIEKSRFALALTCIARATSLGFEILHGGEASSFTSFRAGTGYLNLIAHLINSAGPGGEASFSYIAEVAAFYNRGWQRDASHDCTPRRRMGRALLSSHGPRWPRAQFRAALALLGIAAEGIEAHP
jgi:hypothetical protein